jgi:hypothetical protein
MSKTENLDFIEFTIGKRTVTGVLISQNKKEIEVIPIFNFENPEEVRGAIFGKMVFLRESIGKLEKISIEKLENLVFMLGVEHKIIQKAIERAFYERESYRKN